MRALRPCGHAREACRRRSPHGQFEVTRQDHPLEPYRHCGPSRIPRGVDDHLGQRPRRWGVTTMPANPTGTTAAGKQAGQVRQRPLVSPDLVRRWAAQAGLMVRDGPLDDATVELYLYWRGQRRSACRDTDVRRARPARRAQGAPPPVSPALLQAASCASSPEPCPTCGEPGYLTYVDLAWAIQRQRCHPCGQQWTRQRSHPSFPMLVGKRGLDIPASGASAGRDARSAELGASPNPRARGSPD